jgi:endonuclease/exonuclease/phosphatase family metal-dependent hydrolase
VNKVLIALLGILLWQPITQARPITLMSYNIENLFDTSHDEGKNDWARLPKALKDKNSYIRYQCSQIENYYYRRECFELDWNRSVYNAKLSNIRQVIQSYPGGGPDIIALQEVENIQALKDLNNGLDYPHYALLENSDPRGIDVAILSRFPLNGPAILHPVPGGSKDKPIRAILQVNLRIGSKVVTLVVNHWPSQANPFDWRKASARVVKDIASSITKHHGVIVLGDFNLSEQEYDELAPLLFYKRGHARFYDVQKETAYSDKPGTHIYRRHWSFLDKFLVWEERTRMAGCSTCIDFNQNSFEVYAPSFIQIKDQGMMIPFRFDPVSKKGYSDHFPIVLSFDL